MSRTGRAALRAMLAVAAVAAASSSCKEAARFMCASESDCTLAGMPGACQDNGHCAYPDADCASGLRYPVGAPGGLSGQCADGVAATDGGGAGSSGGSMASDGTSSADGTTLALGSSSGDATGAATGLTSESSGTGTEIPACDEQPVPLSFPATADAFFENTAFCGAQGCEALNYGTTPVHSLYRTDQAESLMLLRFDFADPGMSSVVVSSARLVISAIAAEGSVARPLVLEAWPLNDIPWIEGGGNGTPAAVGESSWEAYEVPDGLWGDEGPPGEVGDAPLGISDPIMLAPDPQQLSIELAPDDVASWIFSGGDSLAIRGGTATADTLFALSRESQRAETASLDLDVCLR